MGIFQNHILLESIDCLLYLIKIKMSMLKDLKLEDIIYQKKLLMKLLKVRTKLQEICLLVFLFYILLFQYLHQLIYPNLQILESKIIIRSSIEKTFKIFSDIKRYEKIRKLTTGHGEDYTTGCLLDYDYKKNYYRLIADDLSR